jgi:hypothetical protein
VFPIKLSIREVTTSAGTSFLGLMQATKTTDHFCFLDPFLTVTSCSAGLATLHGVNVNGATGAGAANSGSNASTQRVKSLKLDALVPNFSSIKDKLATPEGHCVDVSTSTGAHYLRVWSSELTMESENWLILRFAAEPRPAKSSASSRSLASTSLSSQNLMSPSGSVARSSLPVAANPSMLAVTNPLFKESAIAPDAEPDLDYYSDSDSDHSLPDLPSSLTAFSGAPTAAGGHFERDQEDESRQPDDDEDDEHDEDDRIGSRVQDRSSGGSRSDGPLVCLIKFHARICHFALFLTDCLTIEFSIVANLLFIFAVGFIFLADLSKCRAVAFGRHARDGQWSEQYALASGRPRLGRSDADRLAQLGWQTEPRSLVVLQAAADLSPTKLKDFCGRARRAQRRRRRHAARCDQRARQVSAPPIEHVDQSGWRGRSGIADD